MANFTKTFHHKPYATLSPTLPAYSCIGKTVLITGASEGIGYAIARAFALAKAAEVILVGRRPQMLEAAVTSLANDPGTTSGTHFISMTADVFDDGSIRQMWQSLADQNISVDGLILNAARTSSDESVGEEIAMFTANVTSNILMLDCFLRRQKAIGRSGADSGHKSKFLVNISSGAAHWNPAWPGQQAYCASKAAFTSYVQHVATQVDTKDCLMLNLHPGAVYTSAALRAGVPKDAIVWDDVELAGDFCVWLVKQTFLHGRLVWINWDVEELLSMKYQILNDPGKLKIGLQGVANVVPAEHFATLFERQRHNGGNVSSS